MIWSLCNGFHLSYRLKYGSAIPEALKLCVASGWEIKEHETSVKVESKINNLSSTVLWMPKKGQFRETKSNIYRMLLNLQLILNPYRFF